jgi:hypothetical protein
MPILECPKALKKFRRSLWKEIDERMQIEERDVHSAKTSRPMRQS